MKIIKIKDYYGDYQEVPVDDELYEEWIKLENEKQRVYRKEVYHRSPLSLEKGEILMVDPNADELLDNLIREERNDRLYEAISQLTPKQRHRVLMYMENMNYSEIARNEGVKFAPLYRSLQASFKKLRRLMSDYEDGWN